MSKPRRSRNLHGDGSAALTPESCSPFPKGFRVTNAQIAALESRINGQQQRIDTQERLIARLKRETQQLRRETKLLRTALRQTPSAIGSPLPVSQLGRAARRGTL